MDTPKEGFAWHFLSERLLVRERTHIAYGINYEFEDALVSFTDGSLICPENGRVFSRIREVPVLGEGLGWGVEKASFRFMRARLSPAGPRPSILFVTVMNSKGLRLLDSLRDWRKKFDLVVAFALDSFGPFPPRIARQLDHIFVIIPELVEPLSKSLKVPVSFMPLSCDVLSFGSERIERSIDILEYGRQQKRYAVELDRRYLGAADRLFITNFVHPRAVDWRGQRKQFWQILSQSRISLGFPPDEGDPRFRGLQVISARWYEGMAAGCAMVGREPATPAFRRVFDWPDAAIQLPDDPAKSVDAVEELLNDRQRLTAIHCRNFINMLGKHDVRIRFMDICKALNVVPPKAAFTELSRIQERLALSGMPGRR